MERQRQGRNKHQGIILNKFILGASALLLLSACGQSSAPEATVAAAAEPRVLGSGIDLDAMDTSVKPGDNFFRYMNGTWLDETEIPADKSNYGAPIIVYDESVENVKRIIEESSVWHHYSRSWIASMQSPAMRSWRGISGPRRRAAMRRR
jgi:hypothetical protein